MQSEPLHQTTNKPPKVWRSWRVCPACSGRATKIFSMSSGKLICQRCDHEYDPPEARRHRGLHTDAWEQEINAQFY